MASKPARPIRPDPRPQQLLLTPDHGCPWLTVVTGRELDAMVEVPASSAARFHADVAENGRLGLSADHELTGTPIVPGEQVDHPAADVARQVRRTGKKLGSSGQEDAEEEKEFDYPKTEG